MASPIRRRKAIGCRYHNCPAGQKSLKGTAEVTGPSRYDLRGHKLRAPDFVFPSLVPSPSPCLISKSSGVLEGLYLELSREGVRRGLGFSQLTVRSRHTGDEWTWVQISVWHLFSSCVTLCRLQNFPQPPLPRL